MVQVPELLAPAGNMEALVAAVENGADAVYLGGKKFSARSQIENFEREELIRAIHYAHFHGVKVYVTVNTLISDAEMESAWRYLHFLVEEGVDAVIVQDLGLMLWAREFLPLLKIHASTQMTVHNLEGVNFLVAHGVERVVLARELSWEQVQLIAHNTSAELEVFVHGALCFSYSGQCLLSSMVGGRSGNRGMCAQPCRLPYTLVKQEKGNLNRLKGAGPYLLSTKDLKLINYIPKLIKAGVKSLKVEGRAKSPEYVATVVRIYREVLNRYARNPVDCRVDSSMEQELEQTFNRGFTPGYFGGITGKELISYKQASNRGVYIGRLTRIRPGRKGVVELRKELYQGDKLEVWVSRGGHYAFRVETLKVKDRKVKKAFAGEKAEFDVPKNARVGDRIFKIEDQELFLRARKSFRGIEKGRIPVCCVIDGAPGKPLVLKYIDPEGFSGEAATEFIAEEARSQSLTRENLRTQLERLGDTPFKLEELVCLINGKLMVPFSEINAARRKAVQQLLHARREAYPVAKSLVSEEGIINIYRKKINKLPGTCQETLDVSPLLSVSVGDYASVYAALVAGADRLYLKWGEKLKMIEIKHAATLCLEKGKEAVVVLPVIHSPSEEFHWGDFFSEIQETVVSGISVGNLGSLQAAITYLPRNCFLCGNYQLNVFNKASVASLLEEGLQELTLSTELNFHQVRALGTVFPGRLEYLVHGSFPLMVTEHCVIRALEEENNSQSCNRPCKMANYALEDRKGFFFPLETEEGCRVNVFNSKELCLIEELPGLIASGLHSLRIEAYRENEKYVGSVTRIYREALDKSRTLKDNNYLKKYLHLKANTLSGISRWGITKGHYLRGVAGER